MEEERRLLLAKTGAAAEVQSRAMAILTWSRFSLRSDIPWMSPDEFYLGMAVALRDDPEAAKLAMAVLTVQLGERTRAAPPTEEAVLRTASIMVELAPDAQGLRRMIDAAMESRALATALAEDKESV
jgi:hypothetical protein